MGALMALSFSACSNDDDLDVDAQEIQQNTESSYISVRITGSNFSSTRAEDSDFVDGTGDETESGKVDQVQFFFFDKDGKFISKGNVFQSPDFKAESSSANIEKYGEAVVEIDNFDSDNKPALMVTLLNAPTLEGVATDGTKKTITDLLDHVYDGNEAYQNSSKHFIMATSSYKDETAGANNTYYYATKLSSDCFQNAGAFDSSKAVDVYVERLAAKVTLDLTSLNRFHSDTKLMYLGKFKVTGMTGDDNGYTKLYAKIEGWGLNATAQHSYMLKHLDTTWTKETLGFDWNDASRYRSYWGKAYNYGRDGEGTASGTVAFPKYYGDNTIKNYTLKYWSGKELDNTVFDGSGKEYCFENTNTSAMLSAHHVPATATCVLIKAQLTDGSNTLSNIVKFHGGYWTREEAKKVIFEKALAGSNFQTESGTALALTDVDWASAKYLNGHITLKLTKDAKDKAWYKGKYDATTNATAVQVDDIDSLFEAYNSNESSGYPCISYNAGMYYYAPINHLNYTNNKGTADTSNTYAEGYYGVVRNHVYQVVVNGFRQLEDTDDDGNKVIPDPSKPNNDDKAGDEDKKDPTKDPTNPKDDDDDNIDPGHGIEDPEEPIVPNPDEDENWYLSTQINILSWRLVNQYVKI
jgi:hypothetical protein